MTHQTKPEPTSIADAYAEWTNAVPFYWSSPKPLLRIGVPQTPTRVHVGVLPEMPEIKIKVGIIGAGMTGLYAGLQFKKHDIPFHIFEGRKDRVGGRVYTCAEGFGEEDYQYFEAGAMRLPCIPSQKPVFSLIEYLNSQKLARKPDIKLINYNYKYEQGNLVYMNGERMTLKEANENPAKLKFNLRPEDAKKTADSLMDEVMKPLLKQFNEMGAEKFFEKYDRMSLRYYLGNCADPMWYPEKINYVETMTSGTNAFTYGVVESLIEYQDFNSASQGWKTIDNGMSRLPEACVALIGEENITMGAIVYKIHEEGNKVVVTYSIDGNVPSKSPKVEKFDKVLITLPNPVLRMIDRPRWSAKKEEAIRTCNIQPCYKLGLQFKTRFWESSDIVDHPTFGGQSTTDTPSRWIVYPSYGLEDTGKGILITYCWSTDALSILPASDEQRKSIALRDLKLLYPQVDIEEQFTGKYKSVHWAADWSSGVADFLPGQFKQLYHSLQENEGNIYFAGEHISMRHGWIVGALDSAGYACSQIFPDIEFKPLGE